MLNATQINNITIVYLGTRTFIPLIDSYKIAHARYACLCYFMRSCLDISDFSHSGTIILICVSVTPLAFLLNLN